MKVPQRPVLAVLFLVLLALPAYARDAEEPQRSITAVVKRPAAFVQERLDETFFAWESYELDLPAIERQARQKGHVVLNLGGRWLELELQPNNLRAPDYRRVAHTEKGMIEEAVPPVATYSGRLRNDPQSEVRLLIRPDFLQGFVKTADEFLFIDPQMKYGKGVPASQVVVFDEADVKPSASATCGTGEIAHRVGRLNDDLGLSFEDSTGLLSAFEKALLPATTLREVDIATDADYEYYTTYQANSHDQIEAVLNLADFYFRRDIGVALRIRYQSVWTSTVAPYPYATTDPDQLLNDFIFYWNNNVFVSRDAAHLFTGKPVTKYVGQAYPNTICRSSNLAYGVSWLWPALFSTVVAHEIAHNLGASHDPDSSCPGEDGPIMCRYHQNYGNERFSSFSKGEISSYVNTNGSCLTSYTLRSSFTTQTPAEVLSTGGLRYQVGTQFSSSSSGYVMALRFWKAPGETGSHVGALWTDTGGLLASVAFTDETASGWQEQALPIPIFLSSGVRYRVSFNTNVTQAKTSCGLQTPITNGSLTAWQGFYKQYTPGGSEFPNMASCSNFFADVYFMASPRRRAVRH